MTAQMKYYEMHDNKYIPGRWHLRMPLHEDAEDEDEWFDIWRFTEGRALKIERPIRLSVKPAGIALEYTESVGIPVVHRRVVSLFERLGLQKEVQFIPVDVEGLTYSETMRTTFQPQGRKIWASPTFVGSTFSPRTFLYSPNFSGRPSSGCQ